MMIDGTTMALVQRSSKLIHTGSSVMQHHTQPRQCIWCERTLFAAGGRLCILKRRYKYKLTFHSPIDTCVRGGRSRTHGPNFYPAEAMWNVRKSRDVGDDVAGPWGWDSVFEFRSPGPIRIHIRRTPVNHPYASPPGASIPMGQGGTCPPIFMKGERPCNVSPIF